MRYFIIFLFLSLAPNCIGQKKNALIVKGFLFEIDGRYRYKDYFGKASTLRDFNLTYYRALGPSGNWYFGGGAGFRKGYINEYNQDSLQNENTIFSTPTANIAIRKEEWLGRRGKFALEFNLGFSWEGKIKTVDYLGKPGHPNQLKNSRFISGSLGYQYKISDAWNILAAISHMYSLNSSLVLNNREVKLINTAFLTGIRFNF